MVLGTRDVSTAFGLQLNQVYSTHGPADAQIQRRRVQAIRVEVMMESAMALLYRNDLREVDEVSISPDQTHVSLYRVFSLSYMTRTFGRISRPPSSSFTGNTLIWSAGTCTLPDTIMHARRSSLLIRKWDWSLKSVCWPVVALSKRPLNTKKRLHPWPSVVGIARLLLSQRVCF
jgi:hypothetical protein